MDRSPVTVPLQTGIKVIDALIPVGRGQRELILGDRQTGKTAIAIDTILNQRESPGAVRVLVHSVSGASAVAKAVATLREKGAMEYTVLVVTGGATTRRVSRTSLRMPRPSIAEAFMEAGRDVLIVYDDLTHHARAYRRTLALAAPAARFAKRFPGRPSFISTRGCFERATHLRTELGGGSLTRAAHHPKPKRQDISAYIPDQLDFHHRWTDLPLARRCFELGVLPPRF